MIFDTAFHYCNGCSCVKVILLCSIGNYIICDCMALGKPVTYALGNISRNTIKNILPIQTSYYQ